LRVFGPSLRVYETRLHMHGPILPLHERSKQLRGSLPHHLRHLHKCTRRFHAGTND
jgi:hypothetical protein